MSLSLFVQLYLIKAFRQKYIKMKNLVVISLALIFLAACARVPVTKRRQPNLVPESQLIEMSKASYAEFLASANVLPGNDSKAKRVRDCGNKIKTSVEAYLNKHNQGSRVEGFDWQFNTVQDPTVNAWCMPGGMVVFYTGIMDLMADDNELAVVMGHEIAHAIARHGNERMSTQLGLQVALGILTGTTSQDKQKFLQYAGVGSQLGVLAFSRKHELESDKMGLVFMKMAGYDPNAAISFWKKMAANGGSVPEILSTHPSDETRIKELEEFIPTIDSYIK